jgi:transposase
MSFLSRLPAGRKLYKEMILETQSTLENPENIVVYNNRSLFIQKTKVDLYGYVGYAYVCMDIKQKGPKLDKFIRDAKDDNLSNEEIAAQIPFVGKFILVSKRELSPSELLPLYYTRQLAESTFAFSKSQLNLLPLRVHNLQTLKGYTFISYLALILSLEIQNNLKDMCTLHEALAIGHNQFCEIFDHDLIPLEPNKRLKAIYEKFDGMVVNEAGD